ncbi:MAG: primosomal protein N' [Treponema sp. CETP13]|nr:MAG: primosomal protein N' [Treponema sp. CETP13]
MPKWVEVFINVPLISSFTYAVPSEIKGYPLVSSSKKDISLVGLRAEVLFANRKKTAFITKEFDTLPKDLGFEASKIKPLNRIIDKEKVFTLEQVKMALWMEHYYLCSRGEALSAMIPSGRRETACGSSSFTDTTIFNKSQQLSEEQKIAVEGILNSSKLINYLYGSTGTGKTEVFLQAAEHILKNGKGVIYLVPEIGLTHQVIESVVKRFGDTAAVLHSGLTGSQKLTEWRRIMHKEARVIIGARSAVFAPVPDLGMIIIDEEHDSSYKSGQSPRYSARQVAMWRCSQLKIPLLMGSATPSIESWKSIKDGTIQKFTLTKRLSGGKPPEIEVVNLSDGSKASKTEGCISVKLENEMRQTLERGRQCILFLNRRGFSHFYKCNTCGFELKCKNCSVALTYHREENRLKCHYCGWSIEPPKECPECGSLDTGYAGFGTEFIENEVRAKFPNAQIQRVDTDLLTKKGELEKYIKKFRDGKIDIMLGTQMVAKGLNFPNLQLVGVILADTGLHMPDFRAAERTFSLITQVAGRAGRFFPDGKVIVQSYNPKRPAIALACNNQLEKFYEDELEQRKMLFFPPYSRLLRLVFRSASQKVAEQSANGAEEILLSYINKNKLDKSVFILGPSECGLAKIAANYRFQILLQGEKISELQQCAANLLYNYHPPRAVYIEVDIDPVSLL